MLTSEQIAEKVYVECYAVLVGTPTVSLKTGEVEGLSPSVPFDKWEHAADLIKLTDFRLNNPNHPLGSHHLHYVSLLESRGQDHPQKRFELLTPEDVEQDLRVTKAIIALRPQWEHAAYSNPQEEALKELKPDCECGHPYHVGLCPALETGGAFTRCCACDEYEPEEV